MMDPKRLKINIHGNATVLSTVELLSGTIIDLNMLPVILLWWKYGLL